MSKFFRKLFPQVGQPSQRGQDPTPANPPPDPAPEAAPQSDEDNSLATKQSQLPIMRGEIAFPGLHGEDLTNDAKWALTHAESDPARSWDWYKHALHRPPPEVEGRIGDPPSTRISIPDSPLVDPEPSFGEVQRKYWEGKMLPPPSRDGMSEGEAYRRRWNQNVAGRRVHGRVIPPELDDQEQAS